MDQPCIKHVIIQEREGLFPDRDSAAEGSMTV